MLEKAVTMEPHGVGLDDQSRRILETVQGGKWLTRREIAKALGKNQLNPYDIAVLQLLTAQGLIEADRRDNNTPVGWEWVYRAKS